MPEMPSMPMQQLILTVLVVVIIFFIGVFFTALSKAWSEWMGINWFKTKRKSNGNGNGGMTHEQAEVMIKVLNDNGTKLDKGLTAILSSQEQMSKIILATDEDSVPKVHNKPSIERMIKRVYAKVTGGGSGE